MMMMISPARSSEFIIFWENESHHHHVNFVTFFIAASCDRNSIFLGLVWYLSATNRLFYPSTLSSQTLLSPFSFFEIIYVVLCFKIGSMFSVLGEHLPPVTFALTWYFPSGAQSNFDVSLTQCITWSHSVLWVYSKNSKILIKEVRKFESLMERAMGRGILFNCCCQCMSWVW